MVIGLLTIAAIPSTIGVCEAMSAQKKQNEADKEKAKFKATADLSLAGEPPQEAVVVLIGGRLFLDHPDCRVAYGRAHPFSGYYFNYPGDEPKLGLVSTIADDPPMLNWIYADKDSGRLLHAGRKDTIGHYVGPWGWSSDDKWLTYEGDATRFVAAQEEIAIGDQVLPVWGIYMQDPDAEDDVADGRGVPILIRRSFGMESRFVRDSQREKAGLKERES
ncbi:hypothetical protein Sste5346_006372 [Sporothrix stenoceras]|uniref:Uncharacterized protein n=1 Tax=Sporothrix stenoceras TaxID=5173 RepID=A0ABR3Z031_9PEZI